MNVVIVGGTSLLGQRLTQTISKNQFNVFHCGRAKDADIVLDLSLQQDMIIKDHIPKKIDYLVHCAASFEGNTIYEAIHNEIVNSVGSLKVALLAKKLQCKHLIHISSISALNTEQSGSYGLSKKHGHENLDFICRQIGMKYTSLFMSQLYDEFGEARKHQNMLYLFLENAQRGKDIYIYGNNDPLRNFLFIGDVVNIIEKTMITRIEGSFSCIHPQSYRISEIAKMSLLAFKNGGEVKYLYDKPDIPEIFFPDDYDLFSAVGYYPQIDMPTGIVLIKNNMFRGR